MGNFVKSIKLATVAVLAFASFAASAQEAILLVDDERIEREAAAYKDFNLQTTQIRETIFALRQRLARGGTFEQALADFQARQKAAVEDLEKRKSIIGNDGYQAELQKKQAEFEAEGQQMNQRYQTETEQLARLEQFFDLLRQDAQTQLERARQPVLRKIIADRKAKIIMRKSLVMSAAPGLDVTTEFIEQLDAALPTVDLPRLNQPAAQDSNAEEAPAEGGQ